MSASTPVRAEHFELPHQSGEGRYLISVWRPEGLAEGAKVPVLFVTDGDIFFSLAAEIARLRATGGSYGPVVVVGVSYGAEFAEMAKLRTADLTPPLSQAGREALGKATGFIGESSGGAEAFLAFIIDALKPEVAKRYPEADIGKSILFGHSLGGLFAAFALLTRPGDFPAFISSSPSLWWDRFAVLGHLEGFADRLKALPAQPRLFLDVGAKEQDLPTEVPPGFPMTLEEVHAMVAVARMVDGAAEFADALRERGLKDFEHHAMAGEDHSTVVAPALMRGLTFALDGWKAAQPAAAELAPA